MMIHSVKKTMVVFLVLIISGCSLITPKIKTPILLDREPRVSFRYEFESIRIEIPHQFEGDQPESILVKLSSRADLSTILIEREFGFDEQFRLLVPRDILATTALGNLITIIPQGEDYKTVESFFSVGESPIINLPSVLIRKNPFVVTGTVMVRNSGLAFENAQIDLMARSQNRIYGSAHTDSTGFFRFELKNDYGSATVFNLLVSSNNQYPDRLIPVVFNEEKQSYNQIFLGVSSEGLGEGVAYRVIQDQAPFRASPENGADILFFLARGDIVIVRTVAGRRYQGFVEVPTSNENIVQTMHGWLDEQDIILVK